MPRPVVLLPLLLSCQRPLPVDAPDTAGTGQSAVAPGPPGDVTGNPWGDGFGHPLVETLPATSLGTDAFGANGRVQPGGAPADYFFEYGPTEAYGHATQTRSLGPRLAAYYTESWDDGLGGWLGGGGHDLVHVSGGGASDGFCRFSEPSWTDYNHTDGIGLLHLSQYFYPGEYPYYPSASLGAGDPDFRDASVHLWVRGVDWEDRIWWPNPHLDPPFFRGDELVWWAQADASPAGDMSQMSNWAHTGGLLTAALFSGEWTEVSYSLPEDTRAWSYAGCNRRQKRDTYIYLPLHDVLRHLDVDVFHLLLFVDPNVALYGSIDFDEIEIAYRNHSLLVPSNGGTLVAWPGDSPDDPAVLTDGYRFGEGRAWLSASDPSGPLAFEWALADPVTVERIQVHNHPDWPSRDVEVEVSTDAVAWAPLVSGVLPEVGEDGPNFAHLLATGLSAPASHVRVRVTSGYRADAWGLGEVEVFGSGAVMQTDDAWYTVTEDVDGLEAGTTYHYRLVVVSGGEEVPGPDAVFTVPDGATPEVTTGSATFLDADHVRLQGVVNTLGMQGDYAFDLGPDESYGLSTTPTWTGPEITPRTFSRILDLGHPDLAALVPGTTVHWRLVLETGTATVDTDDDGWFAGEDATFVVP